jgi:PTH1 family peptidyl-tRNA hydrolase
MKKVIVGLGNIGQEYEKTYHNVGFLFLDQKFGIDIEWSLNNKLEAYIAQVGDYILVKPTTFMNHSGVAVSKVLQYFKIPVQDLVVVHDDSDLVLGDIRVQFGRGSGGHHGIESIIESIGTREFTRVRIGVRAKEFGDRKSETFILKKITPTNLQELLTLIDNLDLMDTVLKKN